MDLFCGGTRHLTFNFFKKKTRHRLFAVSGDDEAMTIDHFTFPFSLLLLFVCLYPSFLLFATLSCDNDECYENDEPLD